LLSLSKSLSQAAIPVEKAVAELSPVQKTEHRKAQRSALAPHQADPMAEAELSPVKKAEQRKVQRSAPAPHQADPFPLITMDGQTTGLIEAELSPTKKAEQRKVQRSAPVPHQADAFPLLTMDGQTTGLIFSVRVRIHAYTPASIAGVRARENARRL